MSRFKSNKIHINIIAMDDQKNIKEKISIFSEEDRKDYNDFILKNHNSTIFHTLEWKEIIEKNYDFTPLYVLARDDNNKIKAIMPLFLIKNLIGCRLISIPFSIYGGAIGDEEYVKYLIEKSIELYDHYDCRYIAIKQFPFKYSKMYENHGMTRLIDRWSQVLDLKNPELLWNEIHKSNRNSIRKAIKNNVKIKKLSDSNDLSEFQKLELITKKRFGMGAHSINFFKDIVEKYNSNGNVEIYLAKYKNKIIASCMTLIFKDKVFYGYANSDDKYLNLRPNNLILWRVIENSYEKGYKYLDLGATSYKNKGLFFFKSSFNSINVPFIIYYYTKRDIIHLVDTPLNNLYKKSIRKTPNFILKKISPFMIKHFG